MTVIQSYVLDVDHAKARFRAAWELACTFLEQGKAVRVVLEEYKPTRSLEQNAMLHSLIGDIAKQVDWPVDGKLQKLTIEDWKTILTAGLTKSQRVAQGVEGGFVMLGTRTSRMTVATMIELIEFCLWFGTEHDVTWSNDA